jgi:hypothetical protein
MGRTKQNYPELLREGGRNKRKEAAARRGEDLMSWIHDLGVTLGRVRRASGLSDAEFAERINGASGDLINLAIGTCGCARARYS